MGDITPGLRSLGLVGQMMEAGSDVDPVRYAMAWQWAGYAITTSGPPRTGHTGGLSGAPGVTNSVLQTRRQGLGAHVAHVLAKPP